MELFPTEQEEKVDLIEEILSITSEAESPRSWILWAAISSISASIGRNVFLNMGGVYTIFPNLYIMLVGDSGLRKSFPVSIVKTLVESTKNTRILGGRNTIQAMITTLSKAYTTPEGSIIKEGKACIVSEEFGLVLVDDPHAQIILTDWYDTGREWWTNETKISGSERIYRPYITLFGASNQTHLRIAIQKSSITGGLVGRTLFIEETKRHRHNPLTKPADPIDYSRAINALLDITQVKGQMMFAPSAESLFIEFYEDLGKKMEEGSDTTGTANRLHVQVLKVSMILSLSKRHNLILERDDIEGGIKACLEFSGSKLWAGSGVSEDSLKITLLMQSLRKAPNGELEVTSILQKHYGDFSSNDLGRMAQTMIDSGLVESSKKNGRAAYKISELGREFLLAVDNRKEV